MVKLRNEAFLEARGIPISSLKPPKKGNKHNINPTWSIQYNKKKTFLTEKFAEEAMWRSTY